MAPACGACSGRLPSPGMHPTSRRAAATAVVIAVALFAGAAVGDSSSGASPPSRLAAYCSPSGDVCYGIFRKQGAIFLDLTTAARYFGRYSLCVRPPRGAMTCRRFAIRARGRLFGSSIRWHTGFPARGPGRYRVTWGLQTPLGPSLAFRLPGS